MPTKNYAEKFSPKVVERYFHKSYTGNMASKAYDFDGVRSIKVYSVDTAPIVDYNRNATTVSRFGPMVDLTDYVQTMEMTQDKAFHLAVDAGDNAEQMGIKSANKALTRQLDERVYPALDKYNLMHWVNGAGQAVVYSGAITANNALEGVQDATEMLNENAIPDGGRRLYATTAFYKLLKRNPAFVYTDKLAQDALCRGNVGMLDGMEVIEVPTKYMPAGVKALVFHKEAALAPLKLTHYKIHNDTTDVDGAEITGRYLHDAFVLDGKAKGMIAICDNTATRPAKPTVAANGAITMPDSGKLYYTTDGSDPRCSGTRIEASANVAAPNAGTVVTAIVFDANDTVFWSEEAVVEATA